MENSTSTIRNECTHLGYDKKHCFVLHMDSRSLMWQFTLYQHIDIEKANPQDLTGSAISTQSNLIHTEKKFTIDSSSTFFSNMEPLRYYVNFTKSSCISQLNLNSRSHTIIPLEYRDDGAYFYRKFFLPLGDRHQNWFGIRPNGEAVAVSLARVLLLNGQKPKFPPSASDQTQLVLAEAPINDHGNIHQSLQSVRTSSRTMLENGRVNYLKRTESDITGIDRSKRTATTAADVNANDDWIPAWLVIVRREKGFDLRCCVIDRSAITHGRLHRVSSLSSDTYLKTLRQASSAEVKQAGLKGIGGGGLMRNTSRKDQFTKTVITMEPQTHAMLQFVTHGQLHPDELQLGQPNPAVYEKLANLDELELLDQHKFGVLLCKSNQSTESEMYNNEHSTTAFDRFLNLLGRRVLLKDYSGYIAGLDTKTNSTGFETCVTEFNGFPIVFLVSTLLPFHATASEQVARKRHVGNTSVTIIFQEPDALPFDADTILSRFQQVFIVVRLVQFNGDTPRYRVAVCRATGVPPFGPAIDEDRVFDHDPEFANVLLEKACNGANAALKSEKFQAMIHRSRTDYLQQFAKEYVWSSPIEQIRDSKSTPIRSVGRKRPSKTIDSFQPLGEADTLLTVAKDNRNPTGLLPDSMGGSKSSGSGSPVNLKRPHPKRMSKEKRSHANTVVLLESPSFSDSSILTSNVRTPATIQFTCLDFGHTFSAQLQGLQTMYGWKSASSLLTPFGTIPNALNPKRALPNETVMLTMSNHWFVVTTPGCGEAMNPPRILFATQTKSIFAYAFEDKDSVITLYMEYAQYIQLKSPHTSGSLNDGANVCHQIRHFLVQSLPPGSLREVHHVTLKWLGLPNSTPPGGEHDPVRPFDATTDETAVYQRRKSLNGNRCALTDLGLHISFIRIHPVTHSADRERELIRLPCVFKVDADSPAQRSGLYRGQVILKIGTHEICDLFRAAMCLSDKSDDSTATITTTTNMNMRTSDTSPYNPFTIGSVSVPPGTHVAADLLNLIRQLRFSQDIQFVVAATVPMENNLTGEARRNNPVPVASSPSIGGISFPYLRRPSTGSILHSVQDSDPTANVNREPNLHSTSGSLREQAPRTIRRIFKDDSLRNVAEENDIHRDAPLWIDQFKQYRAPLKHKHSLNIDKRANFLSLSKSALNRLGNLSLKFGSSDADFPSMNSNGLLATPQSVRWSFDALGENPVAEVNPKKVGTIVHKQVAKRLDTNDSAIPVELETSKNTANGKIRVCDGLHYSKPTKNTRDDLATVARVQKKMHQIQPSIQTFQAYRIGAPSGFTSKDGKMRSQSNPQLFTSPNLDGTVVSDQKQNNEPVPSPIGTRVSSNRLLNSQTVFPSDPSASDNAPLARRTNHGQRKRDPEGSKQTMWYPMRRSSLQPSAIVLESGNHGSLPGCWKKDNTASHDEPNYRNQTPGHIYCNQTTSVWKESEPQPAKNVSTGNPIDPVQLHHRVQELERQLQMEQTRRSQMTLMCASLLEENRQLRTGRLNEQQSYQSSKNTAHKTTTPTPFQPDPAHIPVGRGRNSSSSTVTSSSTTTLNPSRSRTSTITLTDSTRGTVKFLPKFDSETDI